MKTFKIKNATSQTTGRSQFHLINENNGKKELIQKDFKYWSFKDQAVIILASRGYKVISIKETKATTTLICDSFEADTMKAGEVVKILGEYYEFIKQERNNNHVMVMSFKSEYNGEIITLNDVAFDDSVESGKITFVRGV